MMPEYLGQLATASYGVFNHACSAFIDAITRPFEALVGALWQKAQQDNTEGTKILVFERDATETDPLTDTIYFVPPHIPDCGEAVGSEARSDWLQQHGLVVTHVNVAPVKWPLAPDAWLQPSGRMIKLLQELQQRFDDIVLALRTAPVAQVWAAKPIMACTPDPQDPFNTVFYVDTIVALQPAEPAAPVEPTEPPASA